MGLILGDAVGLGEIDATEVLRIELGAEFVAPPHLANVLLP